MEEKIISCGPVNLADPRLGAKVVSATDDFFADKSRLIAPTTPVFIPDKYDDNGKWMDGWESRRKRDTGYDHCIIKLGVQAIIRNFDIDTSHFTGNFAPAASIEACFSPDEHPADDVAWTEMTPPTPLAGDSIKSVESANTISVFTHLRLNIFPDGGVARLRVYGEVAQYDLAQQHSKFNLAATANGAKALFCNDQHFGALQNILLPGRGVNMGDGWETRRRRTPGADWGIIKLAKTSEISRIIIDTAHFKGNYPDQVSIQAAPTSAMPADALVAQSMYWPTLLPLQRLSENVEHQFSSEILAHGEIKYVRINLIPDGGISRLRMYSR